MTISRQRLLTQIHANYDPSADVTHIRRINEASALIHVRVQCRNVSDRIRSNSVTRITEENRKRRVRPAGATTFFFPPETGGLTFRETELWSRWQIE